MKPNLAIGKTTVPLEGKIDTSLISEKRVQTLLASQLIREVKTAEPKAKATNASKFASKAKDVSDAAEKAS